MFGPRIRGVALGEAGIAHEKGIAMPRHLMIAPALTALALIASPGLAQTTDQTKVSTDTSVKGGVATRKTKVVHTTKRKTNRPKKILGVKVGHKTVKHQTVRETSTNSDGDSSTTVKTQ